MTEDGIKQLEDLFDLGDSDVDIEDVYSEEAGESTFDDKKEEINDLLQEEKEENGEIKKSSSKDIIIDSISGSQPVENKEVIIEEETEKVEEKTEEVKVEKENIVEEETDFDTSESFKAEESDEVEKEVAPIEAEEEKKKWMSPGEKEPKLNPDQIHEIEQKKHEKELAASKIIEQEEIKDDVKPDSEVKVEEEHKPETASHWQLQHPDAKFNHFYTMKKERLEKFLVDGEVPYNAWRNELIQARVDLSSLVFDLDHLSKQMQQVQQHQYRVAEIRMGVIGQYNWCKRSLEFLRGKLSQIAYERPIEKFNGVVYDHLSDIEDYLQQLEVLRDNAEIVTKNLDRAAEVISRRVTVVMMEVRTDNKGTRNVPREGEETEDLGSAHVAPMTPVDLSSNVKEEIKEADPDDEFLDECDVFEVSSSKEEKKPKKGWDLIPGKK